MLTDPSAPAPLPATVEERFMRLFNAATLLILCSPLHGLRSGNTMILAFSGRTSGKRYRTPLSYTRDGDVLRVFTAAENRWWKNLRGGVPVSVRYQGRELAAYGAVEEASHHRLAVELADHVQRVPRDVKFHQIRWDAPGSPNAADVARAAARLVLIRITLAPGL